MESQGRLGNKSESKDRGDDMRYSFFKRNKVVVLSIVLGCFHPCQSECSEETSSLKQQRETVNGVEWKFVVNNGSAIICDQDKMDSAISKDVKGNILVPSHLGGMPVRKIGRYAFYECTNVVSVSVPDGITNVSASVFSGCRSLRHIELPQSIEVIGLAAFRDCRNLKSIVVPPNVKTIHPNTFLRCVNLTHVSLPMGLESVGGCAFSCYRRLPCIELPDTLVTISDGAFIRCESLHDIEIPASVTRIGENVFTNCSALRNIHVLGDPVFLSTARNLFNGKSPSIQPNLKNVHTKSHDFHEASIMSIVKAIQDDTLPILKSNGFGEYSVVVSPDVLNSELRFTFHLPSMPIDEAFRYIGMKVGVMVICDGNRILLSALPRLDEDVQASTIDMPRKIQESK